MKTDNYPQKTQLIEFSIQRKFYRKFHWPIGSIRIQSESFCSFWIKVKNIHFFNRIDKVFANKKFPLFSLDQSPRREAKNPQSEHWQNSYNRHRAPHWQQRLERAQTQRSAPQRHSGGIGKSSATHSQSLLETVRWDGGREFGHAGSRDRGLRFCWSGLSLRAHTSRGFSPAFKPLQWMEPFYKVIWGADLYVRLN